MLGGVLRFRCALILQKLQAGAQDLRIDSLTQLTFLRSEVLEKSGSDVAAQCAVEAVARDLEDERVYRRRARSCRRAAGGWVGDGAIVRDDQARRGGDELAIILGEIG